MRREYNPDRVRLARLRKRGLTQTKLADTIEVQRSAVSAWEAGRDSPDSRTPAAHHLARLADELLDGTSRGVGYFFGEGEDL